MNVVKIVFRLSLLIALLASVNLYAQRNRTPPAPAPAPSTTTPADTGQAPARLVLLARNYGDSVVLRWSPNRAGHFLAGSQTGYWVERVELSKRFPDGKITLLSTSPVRPWTLDEARQRIKAGDRFPAIGLQMLYGKGYTKTFSPDAASIINLSEEQNNRFAVALMAADYSPRAADALGLRWVDRQPRQADAVYVYRIYPARSSAITGNLTDTVAVLVDPNSRFRAVAPLLEAIQSGDSAISLTWHRHSTQGAFSGFYVERSTDGKTFKRLTAQPYIQSQPDADIQQRDTVRFQTDSLGRSLISYSDSVVNYRRFYYRVIGIDAFGDLSPASEVVTGMARDLTPPLPPANLRTQVIDNKQIRVQWNRARLTTPDMAGYVIGRGSAVNGPFESISPTVLSASTLEFLDTKPDTYSNFYTVGAVDTAGNIAYAPAVVGIIADLLPPDKPTGLSAQTDTSGIVQLTWPLGQDDDIVAYKVYRSYEQQNDFYRQLTPLGIADTTFADTLPHPMLNKQVFYKIVAIDRTGNHSLFSAALPVAVPDRMPPTAPVIRSVVVDAGGVTLMVLPSSSVDVVGHRLYRRDGDAPWTLLRQLPGRADGLLTLRDTSFRAQPGFAGKTYTYALTAIDDAKLESERSFAVPVQPGAGVAQPVRNIQGRYDANRQAVVLNWEFPTLAEPYHFVVYRSLNGEGLSMYRAVDGQQRSFQDNATASTGRYQYAVRVQYHQRSGSALSQPVNISR
ncbi:fibronectin type III domain-containing protein [Spirosoma rhododendri]|uniref:Fibronectin type-III domain-containing protein n=1 Tax=Spirosoma rhododendri TaxID=2728024 RepID=A0A7L5DGB4_9BACT|nr:hypothetical protein [Spirosoma rhododendri]QJD77264.1 hypothetical protein HH216_01630 [Spirosoma rhododendri]